MIAYFTLMFHWQLQLQHNRPRWKHYNDAELWSSLEAAPFANSSMTTDKQLKPVWSPHRSVSDLLQDSCNATRQLGQRCTSVITVDAAVRAHVTSTVCACRCQIGFLLATKFDYSSSLLNELHCLIVHDCFRLRYMTNRSAVSMTVAPLCLAETTHYFIPRLKNSAFPQIFSTQIFSTIFC